MFKSNSSWLSKSILTYQKYFNVVVSLHFWWPNKYCFLPYAVKVGSGFGVALGKHSTLASPTVRCKADTYIQQQGPINRGKCVTFNQYLPTHCLMRIWPIFRDQYMVKYFCIASMILKTEHKMTTLFHIAYMTLVSTVFFLM